jgi:RNA polymerase sigma factor (sigma-70 family)
MQEYLVDLRQCTDSELVQKMFPQPGHSALDLEAAWLEFIKRFEFILFKAIRHTYRRFAPIKQLTHDDVLDLVQQIFVKLSENDYRALRQLKSYKEGSVKLFLYAVAANTVLDQLRASQIARRPNITHSLSEPEFEEDIDENLIGQLYAAESNPEIKYLQKELLEQIMAIIDVESNDKTRTRNRKIFLMAHHYGYTHSEIAAQEEIGLKLPGVNSFLNRIKKKLDEFYNISNLSELSR